MSVRLCFIASCLSTGLYHPFSALSFSTLWAGPLGLVTFIVRPPAKSSVLHPGGFQGW